MGSMKNGIIELIIYTDTLSPDEAFRVDPPDPSRIFVQRKMGARMILDPIIAGQISKWLTGQIDIYEHMFGKIHVPIGAAKNSPDELLQLKTEEAITQNPKQRAVDLEKGEKAAKGKT